MHICVPPYLVLSRRLSFPIGNKFVGTPLSNIPSVDNLKLFALHQEHNPTRVATKVTLSFLWFLVISSKNTTVRS